MVRIFIGGTIGFHSKGVNALTIGSMRVISDYMPDARFVMLSVCPEVDHRLYDKYRFNLKIVKCSNSRGKFILQLFKRYWNSDLVVDTNGGGFNDEDGSTVVCCIKILIASFLRKKYVLFPQSLGPFKTAFSKWLAKFALNRAKLIMVRETISEAYLHELEVKNTPIHVVPDIVFLLEPISALQAKDILRKQNVEHDRKLVGVNVSQLINYRSQNNLVKSKYIELMAHLADYIATELDAIVLLIPHQIYHKSIEFMPKYIKVDENDIKAINEVLVKVQSKDRIIPILGEYEVHELKGIIGECDLFIGSRLHACVAAVSQGIPTLSISYSHKYRGIMNMLGLEKYICDYRTMDYDELIRNINELWAQRETIRKDLASKIPELKEWAYTSGKLVKELLA